MAIKDLAVAYNASANADAAVEFAVQMCRKYDATLTGLYVGTPLRFEGEVRRWVSDEMMAQLRETERQAAGSIEAKFRAQVAGLGFDGPVEWLAEEGQPNPVLARVARYYDILLIGQVSDPTQKKGSVRAEDLVLLSGTPLIIVPNGYKVRPFKEYAVVAWDGSRPAARALADAMQILETKKRLDVVSVGARGAASERESTGAPAPDIIAHLQRHGIDARRVALSASREGVGPTILEYCAENDPDVLVMGAYGHSRLREDLFGGVTRHVLHNMGVPVLMAH